MSDLKHEREVIGKFVRFYNKRNNANFVIYHYPEDDKKIPADKRIDAIYKDDGKTIAIEHTSLDGYIDQRKKEEQFAKALGPLEDDLKNRLPMPGYYSLVIPADCHMPIGIKWNKFRDDVRNEVIKKAGILELPKSGRLSSSKVKVERSFEFYLCRHNLNGKLDGNFYISKFAHNSDDLDKQKEIIVKKALQKKNKKLLSYINANCNTVLLFELIDHDWDGIYRAFSEIKEKFSCGNLPSEIYVINASFPSWRCSYLKSGNDFSDWGTFIKYYEINT
ncbi:MAG: hypothetical protein V1933_02515 [Candidatus Omnitrophota bacterium]